MPNDSIPTVVMELETKRKEQKKQTKEKPGGKINLPRKNSPPLSRPKCQEKQNGTVSGMRSEVFSPVNLSHQVLFGGQPPMYDTSKPKPYYRTQSADNLRPTYSHPSNSHLASNASYTFNNMQQSSGNIHPSTMLHSSNGHPANIVHMHPRQGLPPPSYDHSSQQYQPMSPQSFPSLESSSHHQTNMLPSLPTLPPYSELRELLNSQDLGAHSHLYPTDHSHMHDPHLMHPHHHNHDPHLLNNYMAPPSYVQSAQPCPSYHHPCLPHHPVGDYLPPGCHNCHMMGPGGSCCAPEMNCGTLSHVNQSQSFVQSTMNSHAQPLQPVLTDMASTSSLVGEENVDNNPDLLTL